MTNSTTRTLDVPGATITYDVATSETTTEPPLLLIGSPMAASGFHALAAHLPDRTIVTYDPRGCERSQKTDGSTTSTPEQHAQDVHAVIAAVGGGPVDVFASSGGAVNALALVARHPADVRTLVAHEPPDVMVLPDRDAALAAVRAFNQTYVRKGFGAGMARFIMTTAYRGEFPADFADQPDPDPQMFGLPTEDDGRRDDPLLQQNAISCTTFEPDFEALRSAPTRIVIGVGEDDEGEMASRAAYVIAEHLGVPVEVFPSGHGGFVEGWGQPEAFAIKLRDVLGAAVGTAA
jgi:pimeloyl-ACP methyl ester carboxylesterase